MPAELDGNETSGILDEVEAPVDEAPVAETEAQETEPEEPWTKAAALDERKKRQEAEAKLHEMELRIARMEGMPKSEAKKEEAPPNFADLIDFADLATSLPKAVEEIIKHHFSQQQTAAERSRAERWARKRDASIEMAREDHGDYDEVVKAWVDAENAALEHGKRTGDFTESGRLLNALQHAPNPAEYAYRWSKKKLAEGSSKSELEKLKARLAELEGSSDEEEETKTKTRPSVSKAAGRGSTPQKGKKAESESVLDVLGR